MQYFIASMGNLKSKRIEGDILSLSQWQTQGTILERREVNEKGGIFRS